MSETVGPPANNVGTGNIAGTGVGPSGEPGVHMKKKNPLFLFNKMVRRKEPLKEETFAGHQVFTVDSDRFHTCRMGKRRYARWVNYIGSDDIGIKIKAFGYKYPYKPIILKNRSTGSMLYLRYGKRQWN